MKTGKGVHLKTLSPPEAAQVAESSSSTLEEFPVDYIFLFAFSSVSVFYQAV